MGGSTDVKPQQVRESPAPCSEEKQCSAEKQGPEVSPRPAPSRQDATARQFLKAAVQLIDAYLDDQPLHSRPARLKSIRFPAALDWLRTEDVIRLAAADGKTGVSRKA